MSKAILVIDVPDKYSDRDIYALHEIYTYEGNRYERIEEYKEGVHKLKPMPEELPTPYMMRQIQIANGIQTETPPYTEDYQKGYNDCISEILGAEDER